MAKNNYGSKKYDIELKKLDNRSSHGKILSQIKPGSTVLECGCATGYMTKWMKKKMDCHVSVIEIDESCYEKARSFADDGYCGDLMEKGWSDYFSGKTFDFILFADVLEHLTNPLEVLTRSTAFLKDDGKIIVSIPNIAHNDVIMKLIDDRFDYTPTGLLDNTHVHFWGQKNLEEFFEEAGLEITVMDGTIVPTGTTEQSGKGSENIGQNLLADLLERPLGNVYQYVITSQKLIDHDEHSPLPLDLLPRRSKKNRISVKPIPITSTLFYSETNDFNTNDSVSFDCVVPGFGSKEICLATQLPGKYKYLRIDPCETYCCQVQGISITYGDEILDIKDSNGFRIKNYYFFTDKDPQIYVELPPLDGENNLEVHFLLRVFEPEEESFVKELHSLVIKDQKEDSETITSTVFFAKGSEYTNEDSIVFNQVIQHQTAAPIPLNFDITLPENCTKIRIDPCEENYCILSDIQLIYAGKKLKFSTPNGLQIEDIVLFSTEDPQIEAEIPTIPGMKLYVNMKVKLFDVRDLSLGMICDGFCSLESSRDVIEQKQKALLSDLEFAKETEISQLTDSYEERLTNIESAKETEISQLTASYEERLSNKETEISQLTDSYEERLTNIESAKETEISPRFCITGRLSL